MMFGSFWGGKKGSWSTSSSPNHSPSIRYIRDNHFVDPYSPPYGTTSLHHQSRSPSPMQSNVNHFRGEFNSHQYFAIPIRSFDVCGAQVISHHLDTTIISRFSYPDFHQNYQAMASRRGRGRRLPPTPSKPSILLLPQKNINFPELNYSPTRVSGIVRNALFGRHVRTSMKEEIFKFGTISGI